MRDVLGPRRGTHAQTFVFFGLTLGTIFLLCGLAIDSGLLFLAKARMARAVDGASLAAVGNFNNAGGIANPTVDQITASVATIMRNFAVANYTDLGYSQSGAVSSGPIPSTATEQKTAYTTTTGQTAYNYTYNYNDGTKDSNGQYRKFVQVVVTTGAGNQVTSATCSARCPVHTYFIGLLGSYFKDLKVSAQSVATRNPRLIMIVVDRSGSMLNQGGGAYGLPSAVVQFLDFFDTSSDYIGIVSFGSSARVEMPLTTNFIVAGTNILFDAYQTNVVNSKPNGIPGADPEEFSTNSDYDQYYSYSGVRRLKFGGTTAADDGMRLGMEQLMNNTGFNDPDVVKYIVLFTDGAWNQSRTLFAAPGYTNWTIGPPTNSTTVIATNSKPWNVYTPLNTNLIAVPTFCEQQGVSDFTNAIEVASVGSASRFENCALYHDNDIWQSTDGTNEPITVPDGGPYTRLEGAPMTITNYSILGTNILNKPVYARYIDVWLQPGAVDYEYHNNAVSAIYVSDLTAPTNHISIKQASGDSNELVVPGYVVDGLFYDGLDLTYKDNAAWTHNGTTTYPHYRSNNYQEYFMWPDDTNTITTANANSYTVTRSIQRELMFRNYPNLLTGFYITRPDEPLGPTADTDPYTGVQRYSYGLGPYYPAAGFYWPFDLAALDYNSTYMLTNATINPDPNNTIGHDSSGAYGGSRHESYSINMQSVAAAPEWSGEWFYGGTAGTTVTSSPGNTAVSSLLTSKSAWQSNAPWWVTADFDASGENIMTNETAHNTNVIPTAQVWRPTTLYGTQIGTTNNSGYTGTAQYIIASNNTNSPSVTGGYVIDGSGNIYENSMAWSGRPTHYFDFSQGQWIQVADNHNTSIQALPLGNWKVQEYAWHARNMGVTIYSVGYGYLVNPAEQVILAQVANSTNTTAGNSQGYDSGGNFYYTNGVGTAITYNPSQPIGQQFYATNSTDISNDFYQVGQAINAALTQ
jgi:hypothetical protein